MKPLALLGLALAAAACAPATTPAPAPTPAPAQPTPAQPTPAPPAPPAPPATPAPPAAPTEAPRDWHLLDWETDRVVGIGLRRAERELLAGKQPQRTVVVAIIDSGVDTAHVDLRANLWRNADETPGNGRDDDGNGYVDDVHGWNFIGGRDGRNVNHDTFEATRIFARCQGDSAKAPVGSPARLECTRAEATYYQLKGEAEQTLRVVKQIEPEVTRAANTLRPVLGDSMSPRTVEALRSTSGAVRQAREVYLRYAALGITPEELAEAKESYEGQLKYSLDLKFDPRSIVGDDYANTAQRDYGNRDVTGPDADHGTHVAGIIGAVRGNGVGMDGIAPRVQIMALRAVPNGDERDKDVANAIRYAADNGAHIINMSFGKAWSPRKPVVDSAVRYAESKGVLLVHAAGNDGADLASAANFPNPTLDGGARAANWLEIGASSWKGLDSLAAPFSNYGQQQVDVFAPGVDILSTVPGGEWERESGTSMAAPVVSGLAAMLMSYYPTLTAADVKRIIVESATRYADQTVARPGSGGTARFGTLSATGGIVNARAAIRLAEQRAAYRP